MRTIGIFLFLVAVFFAGGFYAAYGTRETSSCTLMACDCDPGKNYERNCNTCVFEKKIYDIGLMSAVRSCRGREVISCTDGIASRTEIKKDVLACRLELRFF